MFGTRATTGPSTLRERIAALQQRGTSPQPTSPPRSKTPTGGPLKAGGGGLRDKIARFEQKGGTPIPRGSFGLGAPPQQGGRRNNELWGNRIPSAGRSSGVNTTSLGRSASLSLSASGRARCVSVSDAQLGNLQQLQDDLQAASTPGSDVPHDTFRDSDMINSLDIATHSPTSPSFKLSSPTSPTKLASFRLKESPPPTPCEQSSKDRVVETFELLSAPPPPPIVVIREEEEDILGSVPPSPITTSVFLEAAPTVDESEVQSHPEVPEEGAGDDPPIIATSVATLERPSTPTAITASDTHPSVDLVEQMSQPILHPQSEQVSSSEAQIPLPPTESLLVTDTVPHPRNTSDSLLIVDNMPTPSLDESSASGELQSSIPEEDPLLSQIGSIRTSGSSPLSEPIPPTPPPKDFTFSHTTPLESALVDEALWHAQNVTTPSGPKDTLWGLDTTTAQHSPFSEQPSRSESIPVSTLSSVKLDSPGVSRAPSSISVSSNLTVAKSAPESPTTSFQGETPLSIASSSVSEASGDSPHVTPILDAFPAVPRYLPPSSLPARARTVSGHTRATIDRSSGSSTSSTKSTPSLSFSSTSSTTDSPTFAASNAPQVHLNSRRPASGLQRSKSQTTRSRPISSVPAWYDDDSDDGEAGWANVIVTTRRY